MTDVSWYLERGGQLVVETIWLRQIEPVASGQMIIEVVRSPADWRAEEEQELILSRWYPPQKWPLGQAVHDVVHLPLPIGVPLETLHIGLVYRLPGGEHLPVTLAEDGSWHLDESGTMLLIPLGASTD